MRRGSKTPEDEEGADPGAETLRPGSALRLESGNRKPYGAPNVFASKDVPSQVTVPVKNIQFGVLLTLLTFHVSVETCPPDKVTVTSPVNVPEMYVKLDISSVGEKLTVPLTVQPLTEKPEKLIVSTHAQMLFEGPDTVRVPVMLRPAAGE